MNKISIQSANLNNSLVFYRALFNRMPDSLRPDGFHYVFNYRSVEVTEIIHPQESDANDPLEWEIPPTELQEISKRMSRFQTVGRAMQACTELGSAIGLIDPDGNKWIVGDPSSSVEFEKCYVTEF